MRSQGILIIAIAVATLVYPFIVFTSIERIGPASLSMVLFCLLVARVVVRRRFKDPEQYVQLMLVGSLCLMAAWRESEILLRFYPVAMNFAFSLFFFYSLTKELTLIEKFVDTL